MKWLCSAAEPPAAAEFPIGQSFRFHGYYPHQHCLILARKTLWLLLEACHASTRNNKKTLQGLKNPYSYWMTLAGSGEPTGCEKIEFVSEKRLDR